MLLREHPSLNRWGGDDSKRENYRRYEAGEYGNKLRTWQNFEEVMAHGTAIIVPRYATAGGKHFPGYGNQYPKAQIPELMKTWKAAGAVEENLRFNEGAPDARLTIQGEVMLTQEHLSLIYSTLKTTMRRALEKEPQFREGLMATLFLRHHLSQASMEDMEGLFERHPNSVVEFSVYDHFLGCLPHRNTIIWEVRNY